MGYERISVGIGLLLRGTLARGFETANSRTLAWRSMVDPDGRWSARATCGEMQV